MRLIGTSRDCNQRSSTVSKKAPAARKKKNFPFLCFFYLIFLLSLVLNLLFLVWGCVALLLGLLLPPRLNHSTLSCYRGCLSCCICSITFFLLSTLTCSLVLLVFRFLFDIIWLLAEYLGSLFFSSSSFIVSR